MNNSTTSLILSICALVIVAATPLVPHNKPALSSADSNSFSVLQTVTSSTVSVNLSNTPLLASANRLYALICNQSTSTVWLSDATATLVVGQGIPVTSAAGTDGRSCYEITSLNLFKGAIYGRAAGTTTVSIVEAR